MKTNDAKVVAAFDKVLGHCNAHGAVYNPGNDSIKVTALKSLLSEAQKKVQAVATTQNGYTLAVNERQDAMRPLPRLATKIVNALEVFGAPASLVADARALRSRYDRKYKREPPPQQVTATATDAPPVKLTRGQRSYQDYQSKVTNFEAIVLLAASEPLYKPNEEQLKISSLKMRISALHEANKKVADAEAALYQARQARNQTLFSEEGFYGRFKLIKKYHRLLFGAEHEAYLVLTKMKFRKKR